MTTVRGTLAAVLVLVLAGCARSGSRAADEPRPEASSGATAPRTMGGAEGPGDGPPNHAANNAWKQRSELTPADRELGEAAAARIRPALEAQRAAGDVSLATTRATLVGLGFPPDRVQIVGMRDPAVAGAAFGVRVGERGCVIGDVRPDRLRVDVTGAAREFGCLEPFSH